MAIDETKDERLVGSEEITSDDEGAPGDSVTVTGEPLKSDDHVRGEEIRASIDEKEERQNVLDSISHNCNAGHESDQKDQRIVTYEPYKRWPNGIVPYVLDASFTADERAVIASAFDNIMNNTCITFPEKTPEDKDWIFVARPTVAGTGCNAALGYRGPGYGLHNVNLEPPQFDGDSVHCIWQGVAVHEFLHVLGFYHEQQRPDRDTKMSINWSNIQLSKAFAYFKKAWSTDDMKDLKICTTEGKVEGDSFDDCVDNGQVTSYGIGYDFTSIMQYGKTSFALDGSIDVMVPFEEVPQWGNTELSPMDIEKVKAAYGCDSTCGGYQRSSSGGTLHGEITNRECEWVLETEELHMITITVTAAYGSDDCSSNYLEVVYGRSLDGVNA